jgi:LuxR family maltose regulon positive regulatory protein
LICAPAGFGKSTVVRNWLDSWCGKCAWLSLEEADNDPVRFWHYFAAALGTVDAALGDALSRTVQAGLSDSPDLLLIDLVNALSLVDGRIALVLDDYHTIQEPSIHDGMAFLLDHMPASLVLVLITRVDPPLPLARLRARRQVQELRAADLRFLSAEVEAFFNQLLGLDVPVDQIHLLEERTEGWAAGLQMAALSLQSAPDRDQFFRSFSGADRFILDYLTEEILNRQPAETQQFLLQTSILEKMNGELCDALTGRTDGSAFLENLQRANFFIFPLDTLREWYRYHHLFADLLRVYLSRQQPEALAGLHRRAAAWFGAHEMYPEAMQHLFAAGDYPSAVAQFSACWFHLAHQGQISTILHWLEQFPPEMIEVTPVLSIACGWIEFLGGRMKDFDRHVQNAAYALETTLNDGGIRTDTPEYLHDAANIAILQAIDARMQADFRRSLECARRAYQISSPEDALLRGNASFFMAYAWMGLNDLQQALETFLQTVPLARQGGNHIAESASVYNAALILRMKGRLREAYHLCEEELVSVKERGLNRVVAYDGVRVAIADVLCEWDRMEEAETLLQEALERSRKGSYHEVFQNECLALARLNLFRQDAQGVEAALSLLEGNPGKKALPQIRAEITAYRARAHLFSGNLPAAHAWADFVQTQTSRSGAETLALARVLLTERRWEEAELFLDELIQRLDEDGLEGLLVEALVLRTAARRGTSDFHGAEKDLERAHHLGDTQGYRRVFLEAGEEKKVGDIAEALTRRELEVLELAASGLSNQEICDRLFISMPTVKKHIGNIFGKLEATSRTQAIARARQLGMIP